MAEEKSQAKSTYFTFLLYPESIPDNWIELLESTGLQMAISPLHNRDKTEKKELLEQGQVFKKEHYHVIYIAKNAITPEAVRNRIKRLLGDKSVNMVQPIATSVVNAYLYLTHESKDAIAKKKHVYDKKDIIHLNNFDVDRFEMFDVHEKRDMINSITEIVRAYELINVIELAEFFDEKAWIKILKENGHTLPNELKFNEIIAQNTGLLKLYFDGNYNRLTNNLPHWKIRHEKKSQKNK